MGKKAQNMEKSPKNKGFRGCWTVPPFWEHPVLSILSKPMMGTTDTWLWSIKSFQSYVLREWCRRDNGVWAVSCSKRGSRDGNLFNLFINHSQFPELSPCLLLVRGLRALVGVYFQLLKTRVLQFNFDIGVHWNSHCLKNKPPDNAFFFLKSAC